MALNIDTLYYPATYLELQHEWYRFNIKFANSPEDIIRRDLIYKGGRVMTLVVTAPKRPSWITCYGDDDLDFDDEVRDNPLPINTQLKVTDLKLDPAYDFTLLMIFWGDKVELSRKNLESKKFNCIDGDFKIALKIFEKEEIPEPVETLTNDFLKFMDNLCKTEITLAAKDGEVKTKLELLQARSQVFRGIFDHDSIEKQTSKVELKQFTKSELEDFVHFLKTDEITTGSKNALGLLELGDMYNMPLLKFKAIEIVIKEKKPQNAAETIGVLSRLCPERLNEYLNATIPALQA